MTFRAPRFRSLGHCLLLVTGLTWLAGAQGAEPKAPEFGGATPLEWSRRMADSEMARKGDTMFHGGSRAKANWNYVTSLFGLSLLELAELTGQPAYADYGAQTATSFVRPDGSIATYAMEEFNIDLIPPGKVLLRLWERGVRDARYRTALETLRLQMQRHPRTGEGGYWHKQRYPHQMWLDGLFMAAPFLAQYAKVFEEPELFDEAARQLVLMDAHAYDPKSGLHHHAWDEKRAQSWADRNTGRSPNFWGRAEGWYAMALVDSLDFFPPTHPEVERINDILRRVADGIVRWQDPESGLWWQVLDQGKREGNYLEATASSMFVYALAKGINRGYLAREKYLPAVRKGYAGLIRDLIRTESDGSISLTRCCEVAGLGYTTSQGRPRDGSFEYYVSERIIDNDLKGVGPFIRAGLEVERLLAAGAEAEAAVPGARGWADYPAVLARIVAPTFPDRDFPITDFGAQPGGDASAALRAAIDACHAAGGGRVVVPAGEWLTGAVHLRSNVNLHLVEGAVLRWVFDLARYPIVHTRWEGVECMNYSPLIYAWEQENIAITGKGTLDGGADRDGWWSWNRKGDKPQKQKAARDRLIQLGEAGVPVAERVFGDGHFLRPNFLQPYRCRNVLVEGVTIVRSPMWVINPVLCRNVTVRGVTVDSHGGNNDGCDPESSRDVLIEDCVFNTGDDCIAIKSGRNNDGRRIGVPSETIVVRNCTMKDGHGGVVLGSECSGGIRNVFVENCTMDSPNLDRGLRFKSNAVRGGVLENVFMRNVRIGRVGEAVLTIDLLYEEGAQGAFPPTVRNVHLENVRSSASPRVLYVRGFPGATIDGLRFRDCEFLGVEHAEVLYGVGTIVFDRVAIVPATKPKALNSVPVPAPRPFQP
ncbi:MAG: glycoside hydrolase family 88 protein [Opitutaceae bacterium]